MLGARTACWMKHGGGMPTSRDYVQGAVFHQDGIDSTDYLSGQSGLFGIINNATNAIWRNIGTNKNLWPYYKVDNATGSFGVFGGSWVSNGFKFDIGGYHLLGGTNWTNVIAIYNSRSYTVEFAYSDVTAEPNQKYVVQIPISGGSVNFYDGRFSYVNNLGQKTFRDFAVDTSKRVRSCSVVMDGDSLRFYSNGAVMWEVTDANVNDESTGSRIFYGGRGGLLATFGRFMMYDTPLTSAEIAANYAIDNARFNLP